MSSSGWRPKSEGAAVGASLNIYSSTLTQRNQFIMIPWEMPDASKSCLHHGSGEFIKGSLNLVK